MSTSAPFRLVHLLGLQSTSVAGNTLHLAVPCSVLNTKTIRGTFYRAWNYLVALCSGDLGEIICHVARVQMAQNPFLTEPFLMSFARSLPACLLLNSYVPLKSRLPDPRPRIPLRRYLPLPLPHYHHLRRTSRTLCSAHLRYHLYHV